MTEDELRQHVKDLETKFHEFLKETTDISSNLTKVVEKQQQQQQNLRQLYSMDQKKVKKPSARKSGDLVGIWSSHTPHSFSDLESHFTRKVTSM